MALFGNKKHSEKKDPMTTGKMVVPAAPVVAMPRNLGEVLKHARITEKATMHQAISVYTFDISASATKRDIMQAVRTLYKVNPVKVAVVTVPSKERRSMRTGKRGVKRGGRKAYVYLKKGDTITIS